MAGSRSTTAFVAAVLAALGVAGAVLGPALANLGWVRPMTGFVLFALGALDGLLALGLGLIALLLTRPGSGRGGRGLAGLAVAAGAVLVGTVVAAALPGRDLPRINDITTDPADPPSFAAATRDPAVAGRDWSYPDGFAVLQRAGYPDLTSIDVSVPPAQAFELAEAAAASLGWEIVETWPEDGLLEARDTSGLFRFVDDVVVRVRPRGPRASRIDVRSKSRDGRGDLGVNAERIRAFAAELGS